jgi:hypothetical protein
MERAFWRKQTKDQPLFPDLLWSRPENKQHAGKLLIIGGNLHGFAAPAEAYQEATAAGIGTARVLLPVSIKNIAGRLLETVGYATSTPSGSFSRQALAEFLEHAAWADGVLLAGDLGRNSETAIVIESFLTKNSSLVTLVKDAADYMVATPEMLLNRTQTLLVLTIAQLQKLYSNAKFREPITFSMDLLHLIDALHGLTIKYPTAIVVKHLNQLVIAYGGQIGTMSAPDSPEDMWRVKVATHAAVWQLQNPSKPFEAIMTSLVVNQ